MRYDNVTFPDIFLYYFYFTGVRSIYIQSSRSQSGCRERGLHFQGQLWETPFPREVSDRREGAFAQADGGGKHHWNL